MKKIKYKVIHQGIRYINDIDAIYQASDNVYQGVIQKLSATPGEYLEEAYAMSESWGKSLRGGLLRKFIDDGHIVEELVDEKDGDIVGDPYKLNLNNAEQKNDDNNDVNMVTNTDKSSVLDWNKLSDEEKHKLMKGEQLDQEKEEKVVDWNSLNKEQRKELIKKFMEDEKSKKSNDAIVKKEKPIEKNKIVKGKTKIKKPKKVKKGDLIKVKPINSNVEENVMLASDISNKDEAKIVRIDTFAQFDALKYQDKLIFISECTNVDLLDEIVINDKRDMVKVRAMKKSALLKGQNKSK